MPIGAIRRQNDTPASGHRLWLGGRAIETLKRRQKPKQNTTNQMKIQRIYGLALAVGVLSATSSLASITIKSTPNRASSGPGAGGGEFIAVIAPTDYTQYYYNGAGNNDAVYSGGFATFCLEKNELVGFNTPYTASISMAAMAGGGGAVNGKDVISKGTAWLYSQFAAGILDDYNYNYNTSGRRASAGLLQEAFWYLEHEIYLWSSQINANPFLDAVEDLFGSLTNAKKDSQGEYWVRVLNIYDRHGNRIQDQLIVVPEASTIIAGALLLLPFGASTLRILRNKRAA